MATDVSAVLQGLECSLCLNLLEEPKQLSCTHSFCKNCLQHLHHSQGTATNLTCPLCRQSTRLGNRGLSGLKTNVPLKSLVGDLKTSRKMCTLCDSEAKSPAVHYCQQCDEYMCDTCLQGHAMYRKNASHVVVSVDDIKSGKVKVKQMCHKHAGEERLFVCKSCKVYICFRCRMLDHNVSGHVVQEVDAFKRDMMDEIESLKKKCLEKIKKTKSYEKVVREESAKVDAIINKKETDINKAYDHAILQLTAKKKTLLDQCKEKKRKLKKELNEHGKNGDDLITRLNSAYELVDNGSRALLTSEALAVHRNLGKELQDMLDRDDPDESKPKQVTRRAEALTFTPRKDEHNLGVLNEGHIIGRPPRSVGVQRSSSRTTQPTKTGNARGRGSYNQPNRAARNQTNRQQNAQKMRLDEKKPGRWEEKLRQTIEERYTLKGDYHSGYQTTSSDDDNSSLIVNIGKPL